MNEDISLKTLRIVVDDCLKTIENPKTRRNAKSVLNQFRNFMPRGLHVSDLKQEDYTNFLNSKRKVLSDSSLANYRSHVNYLKNYIQPDQASGTVPMSSKPSSRRRGQKSTIDGEKEKQHREEIEDKNRIIGNQQKTIDRLEERHRKDKEVIASWKSEAEDYTRQIYALEDQVKTKGASKEQIDRLKAQILKKQEKDKELEAKIQSHQEVEQKLALIDQFPDWEERFEKIDVMRRVETEESSLREKIEILEADLKEANKKLEETERLEAENRDLEKKLERAEGHLVVETVGGIDEAIKERSLEILEGVRRGR